MLRLTVALFGLLFAAAAAAPQKGRHDHFNLDEVSMEVRPRGTQEMLRREAALRSREQLTSLVQEDPSDRDDEQQSRLDDAHADTESSHPVLPASSMEGQDLGVADSEHMALEEQEGTDERDHADDDDKSGADAPSASDRGGGLDDDRENAHDDESASYHAQDASDHGPSDVESAAETSEGTDRSEADDGDKSSRHEGDGQAQDGQDAAQDGENSGMDHGDDSTQGGEPSSSKKEGVLEDGGGQDSDQQSGGQDSDKEAGGGQEQSGGDPSAGDEGSSSDGHHAESNGDSQQSQDSEPGSQADGGDGDSKHGGNDGAQSDGDGSAGAQQDEVEESESGKDGGDPDADGGQAAETGSSGKLIAVMSSRKKCKHWQQMGCLLDAFEKACGDEPASSASGLMKKTSTESIWMCCCPTPYKACDKSERVAACDTAMKKHIGGNNNLSGGNSFINALQNVRADLRKAGGQACNVLAPKKPLSVCGKAAHPKVTRSIGRADLFCEMLSWQWEELGDGNQPEFHSNGCPYIKSHKGANGNSRKGGRLSKRQI